MTNQVGDATKDVVGPDELRKFADALWDNGGVIKASIRDRLKDYARAWSETLRRERSLEDEAGVLRKEVLKQQARIETLEGADEQAWAIIANASEWDVADDGTPCGNKAKAWRDAAIQWRDRRHERLAALAGRGSHEQT